MSSSGTTRANSVSQVLLRPFQSTSPPRGGVRWHGLPGDFWGRRLATLAAALVVAAPLGAQPSFLDVWGEPGTDLGQFVAPTGVAVNAGDTLYVADAFLNRITLFDAAGSALSSFGSTGSAAGQLRNPVGLALDTEGDVYVADSGNHRIQRFHRDGAFVEAYGDSGSAPGLLRGPSGVVLTAARQLYVADYGNRRVQQLDWSSSPPRFVGVVGNEALVLEGPTDVAIDAEGLLYVADLLGNEIVQLRSDGQVVRRFHGNGGPGEAPSPLGLLVDGAVLHVTDVLNGQVEVFDLTGRRLFAWPVGGIPAPSRMALDASRRLFVTSGQDRVVFLYQLPLASARASWSDVKQRFR